MFPASSSHPFLVGGVWSHGRLRSEVRNPYNDEVVGSVHLADYEDASLAIQQALTGFEKTKRLQSFERAEILAAVAEKLNLQREEFARLITAEVGKPLQFARGEVERAITTFTLAAEETKRIGGELVPLDLHRQAANRFGVVRRFPIGVVLGIAPFNFPLNLVAHKVAPAIASGNAFILKPPPQAPLTSLCLAELILSANYPPEALSVLPCTTDVAESLVKDERTKMLSFTGSPTVGWELKRLAGKKKVVLELGGNAGVFVDRSADVQEAVKKNLMGAFVYAGQVCIKVQRIFIHEAIYDEYERSFVEGAKMLKRGDPSLTDTVVGPVINDAAKDRIISWIEEAVKMGGTILAGGTVEGRVIAPTILANVPRAARVYCQEVFGPVVTLHRVGSVEEAVNGINDSPFGLQAGIFSNDMKNILFAYNHLDVGGVMVNENPTFRVDNMPYGGVKDSGFGREGVKYAIEAMTEPKLLSLGF